MFEGGAKYLWCKCERECVDNDADSCFVFEARFDKK